MENRFSQDRMEGKGGRESSAALETYPTLIFGKMMAIAA